MARIPVMSVSAPINDPVAVMNTYRSYVSMLQDPVAKDESKLKALQELSGELETIVSNPQYPSFLDHAIKIFIRILGDGEPQFIAEKTTHQLRKTILEIIHRLPTNNHLLPHSKPILSLMFKLLEVENEENILVVLRIIIEFHKTFRPPCSVEIQMFLLYVKNIYKELPNYLHLIFEPRPTPKVKDLSAATLEPLLKETFTITPIQIEKSEKRGPDSTTQMVNLIPKATMSLKALAELPIIVVLMYQLYKMSVHKDVEEFIPLIMTTITLQPSAQQRSNPSFNKEVYVDFMAAQIKTLSFLAYIVRIYQNVVNEHSSQLAKGMIGLLCLCPQEVAHLRKELLIAARHILATELRDKFVSSLEELFDENILIGTGWTAYESLRPLAYSTLADLVHHVRQHLQLKDLAKAVNVFSKNVHDESLVTTIQTMSCKLILNLVECIRIRSDRENGNGRELLMRMLEVLVLKFKTIAKLQLPVLQKKAAQPLKPQTLAISASHSAPPSAIVASSSSSLSNVTPSVPAAQHITTPHVNPLSFAPGVLPGGVEVKTEVKEEPKSVFHSGGLLDGRDEKTKFGFPASQAANYNIAECRSLVKTLVCAAKTVTWGITACKFSGDSNTNPSKQYQPKETLVFIRLIKYALQTLDIYTLTVPTPGQAVQQRPMTIQTVRSKEEKEVLEHLAGVYTMMHPLTFREVFSTSIHYMVERIFKNPALQILANSFLANTATSPIFATILVEYLLKRMEEMGSNMDRSNLYLKLFKLVFGSVSLFPAENEEMLKPYLHQIVNRSMELALSAKEPYNYFLLLRALFRSIGGGSHDLLYQEFLPLLPNLLQGLNSLQSGLHKQHMKDLFVELCLTVPVRLSSLLPYLPMLMDPLVSALNGSQTLVSQGLRTLELCVDNLQPDFLYDHIQPVRAELMQALWRTLRNPTDSVAQVAFRVLGKFGGGNRKMMVEPQRLEYSSRESIGPCVAVYFQEHKNNISLPIGKIIETAFNALKTSATSEFYRKQCWEIIKGFLSANMESDVSKHNIFQLFGHPSFVTGEIPSSESLNYVCSDSESRKIHELALTGMFVASAIKELREIVSSFMVTVVRHYTLVAISQQAGPFVLGNTRNVKPQGMDPLVIIDAVAAVMGHEEKELCKPGNDALGIIVETASIFLGTKQRACCLPVLEYLQEKMCSLCYERAWYSKLGGCIALKTLFEKCHKKWVFAHMYSFLKALLFVMMDLTGEVSSGAVDLAKNNLQTMLTTYCKHFPGDDAEMVAAQNKAIIEVVQELVRQLTQPNTCVRDQAMHSLKVIAEVRNTTITNIIEPHKELLVDYVPLRKHNLRHQPVLSQIGLLDGNTFCITLEPRLFSYDMSVPDHKSFFDELVMLCECDDANLLKFACYKSLTNLIPIRKSMLRLLSACHYMQEKQNDIFQHLYRALSSSNSEMQEIGYQCIKDILGKYEIDIDMVHTTIRPLLLKLGDYRSLNLPAIQHLSYLTLLFPKLFNEKLCGTLLTHLHKCLEVAENTIKANERSAVVTEVKICSGIINIFHQIPAATAKFIEPLLSAVLKTERNLLMEAGSPYREPLIKFLKRYPTQTIELLLSDQNIYEEQVTRFSEYLLKNQEGKAFREVLQQNPTKLVSMAFGANQTTTPVTSTITGVTHVPIIHEIQFQAIRTVSLLAKLDDEWLSEQHQLVACLRKIWISKDFQDRHLKADSVDYTQWKEPKLLAKCLLNFVKHHPNEIELLFQLLRAFTGRFIPDFEFLRDFLENTVANNYTVDWKRMAFFKFVELFCDDNFSQDLKAKILQYILIPSFAVAFEKGEGERLIGGPPAPEQDQNENVMSVFINKVIDSDNPFGTSDAVRILLLQFSCLLVEQASPHIHDAANKRQGNKLRRLMTFAWPCLITKNCVDPATKYHGHLLLANIIAKFAIHKKIVLQVFHSLLKAHAAEARSVVRQALEILTPAMPVRMEDGNNMLTHWTKKIIVEEGHTLAQLVHMLQLLVRHYKVYYPVRHHLINHMVSSVQRLVFTPNATIEHKRLAVDLAEVIIRWEIQRHKEEQEKAQTGVDKNEPPEAIQSNLLALKQQQQQRTLSSDPSDIRRIRPLSGTITNYMDRYKPVDKEHADAVVNFLLRMACQVNETTATSACTGELLSRRCVSLLKTALKSDVWPNAELKLVWFDKLLNTVKENTAPNYGNICTALELLAFLLSILRKDTVLTTFRPLQRGIAACLSCNNTKVIRSVHNLLSRLMSLFPTEPTNSSVASKYEELECLYAVVSNVVLEGLSSYEKSANAAPQSLFATLMILKSACVNNPCYIDRLISSFMRVLQKMAKEHLNPTTNEVNPMATDLLILSLDLVKNRVGVMGQDMRKTFIGTILVGLIEKSPDVKVLKALTKMVEDWVKSKSTIAVNQSPTIREKSILLVKMMQFIEKRFPNDMDLNAQFLELVHYVYRDESLKGTELHSKLEPAFMAGLRCTQPHIRAKFFEVFDSSIRRRLHERILYIACSQNWEHIGAHFWIKQCIELLLVTAVEGATVQSSTPTVMLPAITAILEQADAQEKANFATATLIKEEPMDVVSVDAREEEEIDIEMTSTEESPVKPPFDATSHSSNVAYSKATTKKILTSILKLQETLREIKTINFLAATAQLCHLDTSLAQYIWIQMFPRIWKILSDKQQSALNNELVSFVSSGAHTGQKDCHPSAIGVFVEGMSHCVPQIPMKPLVILYQGKAHNLWHRACLLLEQICIDKGLGAQVKARAMEVFDIDGTLNSQHDAFDIISLMYSHLKEEDLWGGLWQKRAKYPETSMGVALEQQGMFVQALEAYEKAYSRQQQDFGGGTSPAHMNSEANLWWTQIIRCHRELNNWENLLNLGLASEPPLVAEFAWRQPNWATMKEALEQIEQNSPRESLWKTNLYRGYLNICHPDDRNLNVVERIVDVCSNFCIREWRRLPHVVSHIHLPILQAAQQIIELQDAVQIHQGLLPANIGRPPSLHDMKAIVKTWRNRLPVISDDLSHWSEIFYWRQEHYKTIVSSYEPGPNGQQIEAQANHAMLGVHASAQSIIHYGKIARKHGLTSVCLDALSQIHSIPSVPIVDCFQKIRQQVKCYLQMAHSLGKVDSQEVQHALNDGLNIIDSTNCKYFTKEMTAEFYTLRAVFLSQLNRHEEANKVFSYACQLHDTLVKTWALWGDYLEQMFTKEKPENRNIAVGINALTCYLHSCRHQNESKTRKYLAKALWLLTYDDESLQLSDTLDKNSVGIPPLQWLPWVPQLLTCLVRNEGRLMLNVISQVGRTYPQAVYFPIRTLYLILKIEQREKFKGNSSQPGPSASTPGSPAVSLNEASNSNDFSQSSTSSESAPIRATQPMWRCSRVMHMLRDIHPTIVSSLEGIVDQMVWFREGVYEEVLRQLRQALAKCYSVAYENAAAVSEATVTPHTLNFVKKLVSTFGIGVENISSISTTISSSCSESLARRAQATAQDPVFQKMKGQFTADFDFSVSGAMKLHNLINKLKKWIKILEGKTKIVTKPFLIEEKCRFLNNFAQQTADVEIPGEFLLPKHNHYFVRISRFMPRVDIVLKHNTAARRLYIKGHNGKIYPFLVVNDACLSDARREERVLQLLRMLNHCLGKQKETSKRFLNFTVPRVVPVSPQLRLVEDYESSISLLDIYKQRCAKRGIEYDAPLARFYERLATVQARGSQASHQVLRDILKDVQSIMVSKTLLKDWAEQTYPSATDYWTFRKQFTLQLALSGFIEYVLHLTRLNPDMMYIHQDSGLMNVSYFRFNVDDTSGELDATRPVPFRLTPNIAEFITVIGIVGPMTASMIAAARCLAMPNFKVVALLKAVLRDEMIAWYKKRQDDVQSSENKPDADGAIIIQMVTKATSAITSRLQSLAAFDGTENKVNTLVAAANSHDNLCRMDPAWHPWL